MNADLLAFLNPELLARIRAIGAPSPEEQRAANMEGITAFGLNLIGAPKNRAWEAVGRAGMQGLGARDSMLDRSRQDRMQSIGLARDLTIWQRQEEEYRRGQEQRKAMEEAARNSFAPDFSQPVPMGPPDATGDTGTFTKPGAFDFNRYMNELPRADPIGGPARALEMRKAMATESPLGKLPPEKLTPESLARVAASGNAADAIFREEPRDEWVPIQTPAGVAPGQQWVKNLRTGAIEAKGQRPPVPSAIINNSTRLEAREHAAQGELNVKNYGALQERSNQARREISLLQSLQRNPIDTNAATPISSTAAAWLSALGVKDDQLKDLASNSQKFNGAAKDLVLQKQLAQKGPQTESDARRVEQTVAQLGNTREANAFIIAFGLAQARRDVAQEKHWRDHFAKNRTYQGAQDSWDNGEGGRSLFDDPALAKYSGNIAPAAGGRNGGGAITTPQPGTTTYYDSNGKRLP